MQRLVLILSALAAACSGGPPHGTPPASERSAAPSTRMFVDKMLATLEATNEREWRALLSARMRNQLGNDAAALHDHLAVWRREVLPLARELRAAEVTLDTHGPQATVSYVLDGEEPRALAMVVLENGALHLDEN